MSEDKDAIISELRAKLFPYADATEISGISWDGKYLIGDKASIREFHEMQNRGLQIDVYKRAYDESLEVLKARVKSLERALEPFSQFAGVLFERNFNRTDSVQEMTDIDDIPSVIFAGSFFDARAVLKGEGK